jgi:hypothetical protein
MTDPVDERWQALWTSGGTAGSEKARALAEQVRSDTRRMRLAAVTESLVSLALLAGVAQVVLEHQDTLHIAWGTGAAAVIVAAWLFLAFNRRGTWAPYAASTEGFLKTMTLRCERRLRTAHVISVLAALHVLFTAGLAAWSIWGRPGVPLHPEDATAYASAVVIFAGVAVWAVWHRRQTRATLAHLTEVGRAIEGS